MGDCESGELKKFASASRFSIKSSFCQSWDLTAPCLLYGTAAAAQQTVNSVKKNRKKTPTKNCSRTEEARVKNRARAYCRKPPLHVICVRFLGYAGAGAAQTGQTCAANTHANTHTDTHTQAHNCQFNCG